VFSDAQTYVLEFGDEYIRFYQDGFQILDMGDPYEISSPFAVEDLDGIRFTQSADVVTLTHPLYGVYELRRMDTDDWAITQKSLGPALSYPANIVASGTAGSTPYLYFITSINAETGEESLPGVSNAPVLTAPSDNPHTIAWDAVSGAASYNVYAQAPFNASTMGYIGNTTGTSFVNDGITPDQLWRAPVDRTLFSSSGDYPTAVAYIQQRLALAGSVNEPETVWTSKTGLYDNFLTSSPLRDDDAITFTMSGRRVNAIQHLLDIGRLIILTAAGEWVVTGDGSGILRPTEINPKQHTYNGANHIAPVVINDTALYVQARGTIIRDLIYEAQSDGFRGSDLTIFSTHLFDGYTIVDMAYQQIPHSILWAVRSDGVLLGLTYIKEQEIWGWHKHDTDGVIERVCVVPEGNEDAVYLVVLRGDQRFIERLTPRERVDSDELFFMDAGLSYDGRDWGREQLADVTITVTTGTVWTAGATLTLTASDNAFVAGDVGNAIYLHIDDEDETVVVAVIVGYTDETHVTVQALSDIPVEGQGVAIVEWDRAVDAVSGLDHLDGEAVSVVADGDVIANPNNDAYATITVASGSISIPNPRVLIHVGLPYISDFETLDLESDTRSSKKTERSLASRLGLLVDTTLGLYAGAKAPTSADDPLEGLQPIQELDGESLFDEAATGPLTGVMLTEVERGWDSHSRMFVRQLEPLPASVLAVISAGYLSPE
jgi:hypothetical protein